MLQLSFDDVLIVPRKSNIRHRADIDLSTTISGIDLAVPIISANMSSVTGIDMCVALGEFGGMGILHRMMPVSEIASSCAEIWRQTKKPFGFSFGIGDDWEKQVEAGIENGAHIACLDVAHAHSDFVIAVVHRYADRWEGFPLIIGNIATKEAARDFEDLAQHYPITLKVGIGGGSLCTTRIMTGCGLPTLQSVMDVYPETTGDVIADGGIKNSGDIVKSLVAGADAVMLGGILAGTKQTPGEVVGHGNELFKVYRGSASFGDKKLRGENTINIEGAEALVPFKNKDVVSVLERLCDGIRSGLSYIGARNLLDARRHGKIVQISPNGLKESSPHRLV